MTWDQIIKGGLGLSTLILIAWAGWRFRKAIDAENEVKKAKNQRAKVLDYAAKLADRDREHEKKLALVSSEPVTARGVSARLSDAAPGDTKTKKAGS